MHQVQKLRFLIGIKPRGGKSPLRDTATYPVFGTGWTAADLHNAMVSPDAQRERWYCSSVHVRKEFVSVSGKLDRMTRGVNSLSVPPLLRGGFQRKAAGSARSENFPDSGSKRSRSENLWPARRPRVWETCAASRCPPRYGPRPRMASGGLLFICHLFFRFRTNPVWITFT